MWYFFEKIFNKWWAKCKFIFYPYLFQNLNQPNKIVWAMWHAITTVLISPLLQYNVTSFIMDMHGANCNFSHVLPSFVLLNHFFHFGWLSVQSVIKDFGRTSLQWWLTVLRIIEREIISMKKKKINHYITSRPNPINSGQVLSNSI